MNLKGHSQGHQYLEALYLDAALLGHMLLLKH